MDVCTCENGGNNTGLPTCQQLFDRAERIHLVEYFKPDGTPFSIDTSGTFDQAFVNSLFRNLDPRQRMYPVGPLKNVTNERAAKITETFNDGTFQNLADGPRTLTALVLSVEASWLGTIESWDCIELGFYMEDKSGNLIGNGSVDGELRSIRIQTKTLSVRFIPATDTESQKVEITLVVATTEKDKDLKMIKASSITGDLQGAQGMLDVFGKNVSNIALTGFDVDLKLMYGEAGKELAAQGVEATDIEVYNITDDAVLPTTVTANNPLSGGNYSLLFAAQDASDVVVVRNAPVDPIVKRYDFEEFQVTLTA